MEEYFTKLKHIIPTYLLLMFVIVFGLLTIRWAAIVGVDYFEIKNEVWEYWVPISISIISVLIWLRPRFRVLEFGKNGNNWRFFLSSIAVLSISMCSAISLNFLPKVSADIVEYESPGHIESLNKSRYIRVKDFEVIEDYVGFFSDVRTSGKHNKHLAFDFYFVFPLIEVGSGYPEKSTHWYGVKYHTSISNKLSLKEKENKYKIFYKECRNEIDKIDFNSVNYFENIPASFDKDNYIKALSSIANNVKNKKFYILEARNEQFKHRVGNQFEWIIAFFIIGLVIILYTLIWPDCNKVELRRYVEKSSYKEDELVNTLRLLIPTGNHFSASLMVDLILVYFLIMTFSGVHFLHPSGSELLEWGANRRSDVLNGEWWRLLTSVFIHGGVMHLVFNIVGLGVAAIFVEPCVGRIKFLVIFIGSGLCGSLTSIWWNDNIISVGASGAIFGLFGAIFGLIATGVIERSVLKFVGFYVGINLLFGLTGGIDNAAHIGGLLSGMLFAVFFYFGSRVQRRLAS
jgi:rhomboid protease GluP